MRPQVVKLPDVSLANVIPPGTASGEVEGGRPSSELLMAPQQYAAPLVVTPQVCPLPTLTEAKVSPPATAWGVMASVVPPVPSWPSEFRPQQ